MDCCTEFWAVLCVLVLWKVEWLGGPRDGVKAWGEGAIGCEVWGWHLLAKDPSNTKQGAASLPVVFRPPQEASLWVFCVGGFGVYGLGISLGFRV